MKRALSPAETPQVGRSLPRLESWLKVTGRAEYVHNLRLPGMLYGRIFRSSIAHGRIKRLDVSTAQAVGGVHRVVTAADLKEIVPDPYYGPAFHDQPVLAVDKVRYVGEPVAVVLAADPHVAEEAAHLIVAEYEELPAVYDELEAMTSKAIVHDVLKPAGTFPDLKHLKGRTGTNVALDFHLRRGDAAQALAAADRVFEHRFRTQQVMHSPLTRRAVKISLTMEEQFFTITKHASSFRIKSGVTRDGRICARECEVWWNGGAYADIGPRVTQKSGFTAAGPFDIEHVAIDSYALYTNLPPAGALRGFGIPQLVWAYESHTDMIARALKLDPLEFRRKNLLREGRPQATGQIVRDAKLDAVLERVAERLNWSKPLARGNDALRRGRGIAVAIKAVISPTTSVANLTIAADGSTTLYCGTVDMGQGSDTAMAQIAGEVLDIP